MLSVYEPVSYELWLSTNTTCASKKTMYLWSIGEVSDWSLTMDGNGVFGLGSLADAPNASIIECSHGDLAEALLAAKWA